GAEERGEAAGRAVEVMHVHDVRTPYRCDRQVAQRMCGMVLKMASRADHAETKSVHVCGPARPSERHELAFDAFEPGEGQCELEREALAAPEESVVAKRGRRDVEDVDAGLPSDARLA